jgi:hypothetical protein
MSVKEMKTERKTTEKLLKLKSAYPRRKRRSLSCSKQSSSMERIPCRLGLMLEGVYYIAEVLVQDNCVNVTIYSIHELNRLSITVPIYEAHKYEGFSDGQLDGLLRSLRVEGENLKLLKAS